MADFTATLTSLHFLCAVKEFMEIIAAIALITALPKCLSKLGSDRIMMRSMSTVMKNSYISWWGLGITMPVPGTAVLVAGASAGDAGPDHDNLYRRWNHYSLEPDAGGREQRRESAGTGTQALCSGHDRLFLHVPDRVPAAFIRG